MDLAGNVVDGHQGVVFRGDGVEHDLINNIY